MCSGIFSRRKLTHLLGIVAVHMKNVAEAAGFLSVVSSQPVTSLNSVTQRAKNWVATGGERAIGESWSAEPLLPLGGRTETEVACLLDGKPVHRCLLKCDGERDQRPD